MKAKLVKESIKMINDGDKSPANELEWSQFGENFCMNFIKENMSYLMKYDLEYLDQPGRGTGPENPGYGDDELYTKWDYVGLDVPGCSEGLSMGIYQLDDETIGVKFYADSVSFDGETEDDEYMNYMEPIDLDEMDEERLESIFQQVREYYGVGDEEDYTDSMIRNN